MPSLLQPRLKCFYCGMRSQYPKDGRTRQFTCSNCTATNHLDSNGEITDPPSTPNVKQNTSFAHPPQHTTSPAHAEADNLFCKTCLKNQQIMTNLLAEYLPPEDHPQYPQYEADYPEYRKNLERRYPQVCPQCAPRVQKHLNKTAYAAKADFLTRNIIRSKSQQFYHVSTSTSLLISATNLVQLLWYASLCLQGLWHVVGLMGLTGDNTDVAALSPLMVVGCSINAFRSPFLPSGCVLLFVDLVKKSLLLSLFLIWWNPSLKDRLRFPQRAHHPTGLADFYRFQAAILAVRATAWWYLSSPWIDGSASDMIKGMHGCAAFFIVLGTSASLRTINWNTRPKISFKALNQPLIEPDSFHPPVDNFTSQASPSLAAMSPSRDPFPVSHLGAQLRTAPQATSPLLSRFAIPTPPPESNEDSMDWEPVTQSSPLRPTHIPQPPVSAIPAFLRPAPSMATGEKSPFTGRLPPAPISPAHRLRNPPAPPQFKPTPLSQQRDFFSRMGLSSAKIPVLSKKTSTSTTADEDDTPSSKTYISSLDRNKTKDSFELKPAQWTLQSDKEAAEKGTGLEDMFTTSFRIADEHDKTPVRNRGGGRRTNMMPAQSETTHAESRNGLDMFEPRRNGGQETARDIVKRNVKEAVLPVGLAVLAVVAAVVRDPAIREWMAGVWTGALAG